MDAENEKVDWDEGVIWTRLKLVSFSFLGFVCDNAFMLPMFLLPVFHRAGAMICWKEVTADIGHLTFDIWCDIGVLDGIEISDCVGDVYRGIYTSP